MTTGEELHFDTRYEAEFYTAFLDSKKMDNAVEITFAALIHILLPLRDVLNENLRNYGITTDNRFLFIDHLPGKNGLFEFYYPKIAETYSPITHLQRLFNDFEGFSNLFNLKSKYDSQFNNEEEREKFEEELNRRVNDRLFKGNQEKGYLSLESAIDKAYQDITKILSEKDNYFLLNASNILESYIKEKLRGRNITNYKKSNYYQCYLKSNENHSKPTIYSQNDDNEKDFEK